MDALPNPYFAAPAVWSQAVEQAQAILDADAEHRRKARAEREAARRDSAIALAEETIRNAHSWEIGRWPWNADADKLRAHDRSIAERLAEDFGESAKAELRKRTRDVWKGVALDMREAKAIREAVEG